MVDPGEGPREPRLPLVLDQTGAPKSEKKMVFRIVNALSVENPGSDDQNAG